MRSSIITKESDETENEIMRTANMRFKTSPERRSASLVVLAGLVLMVLGFAQWSFAEKSGPKTFSSAGEACQALHQAVQNHDVKASVSHAALIAEILAKTQALGLSLGDRVCLALAA
jgi:hypothetical protein